MFDVRELEIKAVILISPILSQQLKEVVVITQNAGKGEGKQPNCGKWFGGFLSD